MSRHTASPAAIGASAPKLRAKPDSLVARLRHDILRGGLEPGLPLRQDEIAARCGVSKIPVREALLQLVAEGLVTAAAQSRVHGRRAAAAGGRRNSGNPRRARMPGDARCDAENDRCRCRAGRRRILDQAEATDALDRWSDLNWEFHAAHYMRPAKRKRLLDLIRQVSNPTDRYIRVLIANANYRGRAEREHRAILSACEVRNAEAAAALLDQHIRQTGVLLAAFLNEQQTR